MKAEANYQPLRPAKQRQPTHPLLAMNRSYEAFLRSVSVEALAELCAEAAQAMGFTDLPTDPADQHAIMERAYLIHLDRRHAIEQSRLNDRSSRRRARKANATIETFTRHEIIERDHRTCHICGRTDLADTEIHLDHVIPLAKGGDHSRANVKVACATCNIRKGATAPSDQSVYPSIT